MDKSLFDRYEKNIKELTAIEKDIKQLRDRLQNVPTVSGKVTKSSDDFPYIEEHVSVKMHEPKEASKIKQKIRSKRVKRYTLKAEIEAVETFIRALPEGKEKQIMVGIYLEGKTQRIVAKENNCTQARVSQIVRKVL